MVPIFVGERVGIATPGDTEQLAKCCDLFRAQFVAPNLSHDRHDWTIPSRTRALPEPTASRMSDV
jgi:hypothetical protein